VSLGGGAGEKALRFWQRLVRDEHVMRPPAGRDYQAWQSTNETFLRGGVAMIWSSTAFVRYLEDNAPFPVVAGPLPKDVRASVPTGGTMFVLLRSAPEKRSWRAGSSSAGCATRSRHRVVDAHRVHARHATAVERLVQRGWYDHHPNDRVAYDQLADVEPWPWAPELFRIERDIVEPRLEDAVLDGPRRARSDAGGARGSVRPA
jgi:sn-glycerol 3-phosphate transport system substrate-binding protein